MKIFFETATKREVSGDCPTEKRTMRHPPIDGARTVTIDLGEIRKLRVRDHWKHEELAWLEHRDRLDPAWPASNPFS